MRPFSPGNCESFFFNIFTPSNSFTSIIQNFKIKKQKFTFRFQYWTMNTLCDKFWLLTVYCGGKSNRQKEGKVFHKAWKIIQFYRPRDNVTMHLKWQRNLPHWWFWKWLEWFWNPFSHARKWCSQIHTWGLKYPAQKKPILSISWIDFSAIFIQDYFRVPWLHRQPFLGHLVV